MQPSLNGHRRLLVEPLLINLGPVLTMCLPAAAAVWMGLSQLDPQLPAGRIAALAVVLAIIWNALHVVQENAAILRSAIATGASWVEGRSARDRRGRWRTLLSLEAVESGHGWWGPYICTLMFGFGWPVMLWLYQFNVNGLERLGFPRTAAELLLAIAAVLSVLCAVICLRHRVRADRPVQ